MSLKPISEVTREEFVPWYLQFRKEGFVVRMIQMKTVFDFCKDKKGQEFSMIDVAEKGGMRTGSDVAKILYGYVISKK